MPTLQRCQLVIDTHIFSVATLFKYLSFFSHAGNYFEIYTLLSSKIVPAASSSTLLHF